jgi:hypothetical protein
MRVRPATRKSFARISETRQCSQKEKPKKAW